MAHSTAPLTARMAFSVAEAGELVGVGPDAIYALIRTGELRTAHIGRRVVIRREELERFLKAAEK